MARRTMRKNDVVIIDYSDLNAIAIVTDRSENPGVTQGIGRPGLPAFKLQYVIGLTMIENEVEPAIGFIWLNDDPESMSIVGVNGCLLPTTFYGVDVLQAFRDIGVDVNGDRERSSTAQTADAGRRQMDDAEGEEEVKAEIAGRIVENAGTPSETAQLDGSADPVPRTIGGGWMTIPRSVVSKS